MTRRGQAAQTEGGGEGSGEGGDVGGEGSGEGSEEVSAVVFMGGGQAIAARGVITYTDAH